MEKDQYTTAALVGPLLMYEQIQKAKKLLNYCPFNVGQTVHIEGVECRVTKVDHKKMTVRFDKNFAEQKKKEPRPTAPRRSKPPPNTRRR